MTTETRQQDPDFYFGGCPQCGCDMTVDVGRNHYGVCEQHLVYWGIGENLFSRWREQTEEQKVEAIALLRQCSEVAPINFKHEIRTDHA